MNRSSECLSQNDISRLVFGMADAGQTGILEAHLDSCDLCQVAHAEFLHQTTLLEKRLQRITLEDLAKADLDLQAESDRSTVDLNRWLGNKAEELAAQTALFATPCRMGQYEIHGLIAPGGMGEVYRATHLRLKRDVAIKVIRRNQQESPVFYENFLKEIETLGQLDHPNMVRAFDALEFDGYLFLVMELLDGESLRGLATRRCCISLREVLGVMLGLAEAIQHLHDNGYLHLDIKPSNVMLLRNGTTKLIDYGLAMPDDDASQPGVRVFRGTAGYMPPEQMESGRVSRSTDIYGAGEVFRYLLDRCLESPTSGNQDPILKSTELLVRDMTVNDTGDRLRHVSLVIDRLQSILQDLEYRETGLAIFKRVSPAWRGVLAGTVIGALALCVILLCYPAFLSLAGWTQVSQRNSIRMSRNADIINSIGMPLNVLPDGRMTSELSVRVGKQIVFIDNKIFVPQPLYMGRCEVTQEQYAAVMGEHQNEYFGELQPAESMTIEDAIEFCRRLSNLDAEKAAGRVYRLPTSDEWEFACRAGSTTKYSFGNKIWQMDAHGWYNGNSGTPQPVAQKRTNGWGFVDMHGNVSEYVLLDDEDHQAISDATGSKSWWGLRGGSWAAPAVRARSNAIELPDDVENATAHGAIGFRVVCNLLPVQEREPESKRLSQTEEVSDSLHTITLSLHGERHPKPVRTSNAILFRETDNIHYWTTEKTDQWAEIEYQFLLPGPIESVVEFEHLAWVYNENHYPAFDPAAKGTVEVSGDDGVWHVIFHSESERPVSDQRITVLPLLRGSRKIGVRAKLYSGRRGKYVYYSQFLRSVLDDEPHQLKFTITPDDGVE